MTDIRKEAEPEEKLKRVLHKLFGLLDGETTADKVDKKGVTILKELIEPLLGRIAELEAEIKDRQDTEQSLTNWVSKDGEKIKELESDLHRYKHLDAEHERAKVAYGKLVEELEAKNAQLATELKHQDDYTVELSDKVAWLESLVGKLGEALELAHNVLNKKPEPVTAENLNAFIETKEKITEALALIPKGLKGTGNEK